MQISKYFLALILVALFSLILIFYSLWKEIEAPLSKEPPSTVHPAPFTSQIAGIGVVEPSSGQIDIGTSVNRIVETVDVSVGQKVNKGEILFQLENHDLKANLMAQEAAYKIAEAQLEKLKALPRPEDLAASKAVLENAKAELEFAKKQYEMVEALPDLRALSQDERNRRLLNYQQAQSKERQAQAELDKVEKGAWKPDLEIATLEVAQAKSNIERTKAEIEQTIIKAPIEGTVLQIKIHPGELSSGESPLMVLGDTEHLNMRVSINQLLIPQFLSQAKAVAYLQGNERWEYPLEFIRIEPYLQGKQNVGNAITEKVDTRVMHILYRIQTNTPPLYVGEQLDVYIESRK